MPKFKSKHIDVFRTPKAHMISLGRREGPVWIPAYACECVEDSRIKGQFATTIIYQCTMSQSWVDKLPKLLTFLEEKGLIFDIEL